MFLLSERIFQNIRIFLQIIFCGALLLVGIFSCSGGVATGGGNSTSVTPANPTGIASNAGPETPPITVSLDPNCETGAKPAGDCKGSSLPPPLRPCPANLTVIKDLNTNVWWCGCPEGTQEIKNSDGKQQCICPSGQGLMINLDTGEALGCPLQERPADEARVQSPCTSGLVLLEERNEIQDFNLLGIANVAKKKAVHSDPSIFRSPRCGCPDGSRIWRGEGVLEGQQACQCPSGQLLPVDERTSRATKTCEELAAPCRPGFVLLMPVTPGHPNFCGCPEGTEYVYPEGGGAAIGCQCPFSGARVQVDPRTSEMIGTCAVHL